MVMVYLLNDDGGYRDDGDDSGDGDGDCTVVGDDGCGDGDDGGDGCGDDERA